MPMYRYKCKACGEERDQYSTIAEMESSAPKCHGARMRVKIVPTMVAVREEIRAVSPIDGTVLTSQKQRKEHMASHGVMDAREFGSSSADYAKRKASATKARDAAIIARG